MVRPEQKSIYLLMELRKDGRQPLTEISKKISMPVSTIFDRLRLSRESVIKRFTCLLDFSRIGFSCRTQMVFRIRKDCRQEMQAHLMKSPNVNAVYKINNGYDFLVEAVFRELKDVDEFLDKVDERFKVQEKHVYYIIEDLGREMFMTDKVHAELIGAV
jgi:Lrp/AsnC family transcriptional regulator, regulator for asnA, asnC and gidA